MKAKQYYELGKYFIVISQVIVATRIVSQFLPGHVFDLIEFLLPLFFALVTLAIGLLFIGKGEK